MNIPLDNLYHWAESLLPGPAVLYVFHPPGSKKISDCNWLNDYDLSTIWKLPAVIAHDQEPLDWDFYNYPEQYLDIPKWKQQWQLSTIDDIRLKFCSNFNLKSLAYSESGCIYDQAILIHSEKNSVDLEKYQQNGFLGVHYWAHAVIARDWYRFAEYDTRLHTAVSPQNKFLIYCRDWSHRREYRLKFLELLVQHNLSHVTQTSVMHTNSENVHFSQHQFENPEFELTAPESIDSIAANAFSSTASAYYDFADYVNSEISVVLETVFDDSRIHLTEKTLRPIACGHPFLLAAGPGSLEYIRSYGFQTFAPWIDESYDQETNSLKRLEKIIESMKKIQQLQGQDLEDFSRAVKDIANFNKKHFFSSEFFGLVQNELQVNLAQAYDLVKQTRGRHYLKIMRSSKHQGFPYPKEIHRKRTQFLRQLRQSCQDAHSNQDQDPAV